MIFNNYPFEITRQLKIQTDPLTMQVLDLEGKSEYYHIVDNTIFDCTNDKACMICKKAIELCKTKPDKGRKLFKLERFLFPVKYSNEEFFISSSKIFKKVFQHICIEHKKYKLFNKKNEIKNVDLHYIYDMKDGFKNFDKCYLVIDKTKFTFKEILKDQSELKWISHG